jgi:hypothetical protein
MSQKRSYTIPLILSVLIHVILLLLYRPLASFTRVLPTKEDYSLNQTEPQPIEFELVETPEDAAVDRPPQDARFLSDKNARSRDLYTAEDLNNGLPYSEGQTEYKLFAGGNNQAVIIQQQDFQRNQTGQDEQEVNRQGEQSQTESSQSMEFTPDYRDNNILFSQQKFSKEMLLGGSSGKAGDRPEFSDDVNWDNRKFSADELGGVSLSTYSWDFAPYIIYMKRRLRDHIYPPPAFMQMGAISGEVVIRFKVYRDGSTKDIEVVGYKGHQALVETSVNAVKASSPFRPLPEHFPDEFLGLTWTFIYSILR